MADTGLAGFLISPACPFIEDGIAFGGVAEVPSPPIHHHLEIVMKTLVAALIGMFILAGCNTMAGVGEDTQAAGKKLENSAERNKNYKP